MLFFYPTIDLHILTEITDTLEVVDTCILNLKMLGSIAFFYLISLKLYDVYCFMLFDKIYMFSSHDEKVLKNFKNCKTGCITNKVILEIYNQGNSSCTYAPLLYK